MILEILKDEVLASNSQERVPEIKVRRGLGILESLILEKNPDFFKI
jgi:hypothetical protein